MQDVRDAVENDDPEPAVARHLEKLTRILSAAGALVGGGTGIVQAIKALARELGSAGGGVLGWLP